MSEPEKTTAPFRTKHYLPPEAELQDPWAHRSEGLRCRTCMWFVAKIRYSPTEDREITAKVGRCRKRAPTMDGYPAVFPTDWCGAHKVDETKL